MPWTILQYLLRIYSIWLKGHLKPLSRDCLPSRVPLEIASPQSSSNHRPLNNSMFAESLYPEPGVILPWPESLLSIKLLTL